MVYDLAVVGAGPGGLHTAKWAARKGLKVLLIEMRKDISKITRYCSEHIILDEGYNGDTIAVDTGKGEISSKVNGWTIDYGGELHPITDKYYYSPGGHAIHFAWHDGRPFAYKYDKGLLLQSLLGECQSLGVDFMNETMAYDAIDSREVVHVKCVSKGKKSRVQARKLVVADGCNSRLGQAMGFNERRTFLGITSCLSSCLSGVEDYNPSEWTMWFGRCYGSDFVPMMGTGPTGHFDKWADVVVMGNQQEPPEKTFNYLITQSPLAGRFKNAKIEKQLCCSVKASTPLTRPYRGNTLLIGDAAAFVEVQVQGALNCGYRAADAVAKELEGKEGFQTYRDWWIKSFEFHAESVTQLQQGYALVPTYSDDELDYLFALCEGITLDGSWSQYKSTQVMWNAMLKDSERIKQERPALYQKIKKQYPSRSK